MKRHWLTKMMAAAGAAALLAGGPRPAGAKDTPALELARQLNEAFIQVADQVSPSVVVVRVAQKTTLSTSEDPDLWEFFHREFRRRFGTPRDKEKESEPTPPEPKQDKSDKKRAPREPVFNGEGSGLVIREEGYLLTNRHVVDGAEKIKVRFKDGDEFDAEVRGSDVQSDLAVLKINPQGKKLVAAKLGDSDKTRVGEFAIAIGAPFELDYSVTFGHVSAKGRSHVLDDPSADQDFIQTDANINPGNSGGPLVNISGEVIGINTLIRGLRTGIGFSIPSNLAREVAERLITDGKFVRSYLGVQIRSLRETPDYRDMVGGLKDGVVVMRIPDDGPAAKSDLKASDIITAVDGKPVSTPQQLRNEVRNKRVGQVVTLDVHRDGKAIKVKVATGAWPDEPTIVSSKSTPKPQEKEQALGLTVQALTKELAGQHGVEKAEGLIVTAVEPGSAAELKGIRPGDLVTEVNRKPVSSLKQFRDAIKAGDPKKGIIINFTSRGTSKFEVLKEVGD